MQAPDWLLGVNVVLQRPSPALDPPMRALSWMGREEFFVLAVAFLYWAVSPVWGARALALIVLSDTVNGIMKWAFHAPRPYWISPDVRAIAVEPSYGIPSGHAQTGVAFWGWQARTIGRPWAWAAAAIIVLGISASRLYLGVHFLHDVVAGWLIGAALLFAYPALERWAASVVVPRPRRARVAVACAGSAAVVVLSLAVWSTLAAVVDPPSWSATAAQATGGAGIEPRSLLGSVSTWGAMVGAAVGLAIAGGVSTFDSGGPWPRRLLRFAVGLAGILVIRIGLAVVFPSGTDAAALLLRSLRYAAMGLWTVWLAPATFVRLGLASIPRSGAP